MSNPNSHHLRGSPAPRRQPQPRREQVHRPAEPRALRPRQERHLHRAHRGGRALLDPHQRHPAAPAEHLQPGRAERVHPRARDRHGDGHHRRPHRPVGRIGRGLRRRLFRRVRRAMGPAMVALGHPLARHRRARRRVAGLLDRLRRHPSVHRDPGGHAHLPRARPGRARQREHRLVPGRVPRARQRLPHGRVRRVRARPAHARRRRARDHRHHRAAGAHPSRPPEVRPGRRAHGMVHHQARARLGGDRLLRLLARRRTRASRSR